jgi:RimJ/RimL family protein N-acetyltransferase
MSSWLAAAPPEEIEAGSVRLRRWRLEDAGFVTHLVSENLEHLRPWLPWAQSAPTIDEERAFLERMHRAWERRTDFAFAVTLVAGEPIGAMGLHSRPGPGALEIGYWIAAAHTRRGHATAAARALTGAAFALPGVARVEIRCDEANRASAAVPGKLGYELVKVVDREPAAPAETGRHLVWAMKREDWAPA